MASFINYINTEHSIQQSSGFRNALLAVQAKIPTFPEKTQIRIAWMTAAESLINAPEFTVSELSSALRRTVEDAYGHVRVRGEISGFRGPHSSGHCYFALKDESA